MRALTAFQVFLAFSVVIGLFLFIFFMTKSADEWNDMLFTECWNNANEDIKNIHALLEQTEEGPTESEEIEVGNCIEYILFTRDKGMCSKICEEEFDGDEKCMDRCIKEGCSKDSKSNKALIIAIPDTSTKWYSWAASPIENIRTKLAKIECYSLSKNGLNNDDKIDGPEEEKKTYMVYFRKIGENFEVNHRGLV